MNGKSLLSLLLVLSLTFSYHLFAETVGIRVTSVVIETKLATHPEEKIRALITLREGDLYTPEILEEARSRMMETGLFETVEVEASPSGGGVALHWFLAEARLVRSVSVSGNYPYLGKKIIRLSSLQPGDPYQDDLVTESEKRIRDFFEKEGYHGAKVAIKSNFGKGGNIANLKIRIKKGKILPMGVTSHTGNEHVSDATVRGKLFSFNRFKMKKLKKRIKRLQNYYMNRGFVRSRVKLLSAQTNPETQKVDVVVDIQEKKKLVVEFDGIGWFKPQTLKNQTVFEQERSFDRISIERSAEKILSFYHVNGFLRATVQWSQTEDEELKKIHFDIYEGPQTRLKKIDFKGNKSFSTRTIVKVMEAKIDGILREGFFQEALIEPDMTRIIEFYKEHGFFDVRIPDWDVIFSRFGDQATLVVHLEEGERYKLREINLVGNKNYTSEELIKKSGLKPSKYEIKKINRARNKLTNFLLDRGYAYAQVTSTEKRDSPDHTVDVTLTVNEGPLVRVGNIIVSGEYHTREKVVVNTLKIREGDLFRYKKMLDGQLNLKRLGIFDHVRITPMGFEEQRGSVDLVVNIQERKSLTLDIQGGYDSDKQLTGELLITKRNLFGLAKQIQLRGVGGFELSRGEATFFSPRVYGASWNLVNQYFVQYEDDENFNAFSLGGSLGTLKHFGPDWTFLMREQITRFNLFESQSNQQALADHLFDSTFSELAVSTFLDTRDNFADPQSGIYALLSTEFNTDLANLPNNFNITKLALSHYQGFAKRVTLVNTLRVGNIFDLTDEAGIPAQKLFFMGGNDTVRGFDEDAIRSAGGTTSLLYNIELQLQIFNNLKIAGFLDTGSLTDRFTDVTYLTFREGGGGGIRYITPVGPIRLDYGFILDRRPGEQRGRFHLSFGYYF